MRWLAVLSVIASAVPFTNAIFRDDAFHVDFHQALLGVSQSTLFHKPQSSSNASLLYSISDKGFLGAINPKDGSLLWRQVLEDQTHQGVEDSFLVPGQDGTILSGYGRTLSAWDGLDGRLEWDHKLPSGALIKGLQVVPTLGGTGDNSIQDVVFLSGPTTSGAGATVSRLSGGIAPAIWEHKDTSASYDSLLSIAVDAKHVYYTTRSSGLLNSNKAKVVVLDINTGAELSQYSVSADSEPLLSKSLTASCGETPFMLSADKPYKSMKFNLLGQSKSVSLPIEDKGETVESIFVHHACGVAAAPHFLVHFVSSSKQWAQIYHIDARSGDASKAYSLPATSEESAFAASSIGAAVYFARITDTEIILHSSESHGQLNRWPMTASGLGGQATPRTASMEVSVKGNKGFALRSAITSSHGALSLVLNGETQWSRPETLAYITKAVLTDDIRLLSLAQEVETEATSNPVTAYVHRLMRHLQDLSHLPAYLVSLPSSFSQPNEESSASVRQGLTGGKLVLAATSRNELLVLDITKAGSIQARVDLSEKLAVDARAIHLLAEGETFTAYYSDGSVVIVDISTGRIVQFDKGSSAVAKIANLPGSLVPTILKITAEGKPQVSTDAADVAEGNALLTITDSGEAVGWSIGTTAEKLWTVRPPSGSRFVDVVARQSSDPTASIGKVLGDRSVLYKYISPNIALLTALSSTALTVYVVDAVTGSVLHTATHEETLAKFPISAAVSENWFAYTFTSRDPTTSGLTTQIVVSEMYESDDPNDRGLLSAQTNYSSFAPDAGAKPYVITQAYTVAEPIANLTVSQTLQGITSRHLMAYMPSSNAILGIPRDVLNARRPMDRDPSALEMEEGLFRYSPILELDSKLLLTHTREVIGIQNILSAPTLLESTTTVFAYGHDIFGTQLAPSGAFDILGKGFKRVQLVLTVVALYAGVLALRPIVRRKMVERMWL